MAAEGALIIKLKVKIKVFGVGGGGNSVLMRMGHHKELDIDLVAINTDAKQLARVAEEGVETLQIGEDLTKGRGTGGNIALGEKAASTQRDKIREARTAQISSLLRPASAVVLAQGGACCRQDRARPRDALGRRRHAAVQLRGQPQEAPGNRASRRCELNGRADPRGQ